MQARDLWYGPIAASVHQAAGTQVTHGTCGVLCSWHLSLTHRIGHTEVEPVTEDAYWQQLATYSRSCEGTSSCHTKLHLAVASAASHVCAHIYLEILPCALRPCCCFLPQVSYLHAMAYEGHRGAHANHTLVQNLGHGQKAAPSKTKINQHPLSYRSLSLLALCNPSTGLCLACFDGHPGKQGHQKAVNTWRT